MILRRACLVVPGASPAKLASGSLINVDEAVIDLEDSVVPALKDEGRELASAALGHDWRAKAVAVRVNAIRSLWRHLDLAAVVQSERAFVTAVLPKVERAQDLGFADRLLEGLERAAGRTVPVRLLALIETAAGLSAAAEIARASARLDGLVLGYADLAASPGRPSRGTRRFAQDDVLVAARAGGIQAVDGPHLRFGEDDAFRAEVENARSLGFDGKWAIHPSQVDVLREAFTPTEADIADAQATLDALAEAGAAGTGALAREGKMLDEALATSARRTLARAASSRKACPPLRS